MRFIKASERRPSKPGSYFCREISTGRKFVSWYGHSARSLLQKRNHDIEWLDCEIESEIMKAVELVKKVSETAVDALIEYYKQPINEREESNDRRNEQGHC